MGLIHARGTFRSVRRKFPRWGQSVVTIVWSHKSS